MAIGSASEKWRLCIVLLPDGSDTSYFERTFTFSDLQTLVRKPFLICPTQIARPADLVTVCFRPAP